MSQKKKYLICSEGCRNDWHKNLKGGYKGDIVQPDIFSPNSAAQIITILCDRDQIGMVEYGSVLQKDTEMKNRGETSTGEKKKKKGTCRNEKKSSNSSLMILSKDTRNYNTTDKCAKQSWQRSALYGQFHRKNTGVLSRYKNQLARTGEGNNINPQQLMGHTGNTVNPEKHYNNPESHTDQSKFISSSPNILTNNSAKFVNSSD